MVILGLAKSFDIMNRAQRNATQPDHKVFWQFILQKLKMIKIRKKCVEVHTFLNCNLYIFWNDLPNVAIGNSIQTYENFWHFSNFLIFCVPDIWNTNKVRNKNQKMLTLFTCNLINFKMINRAYWSWVMLNWRWKCIIFSRF